MDYGPSDSSGTDDDFPPNQNHNSKPVRISRSARSASGAQCSTMQNDMKRRIHQLEQEAYSSVLRAFKAQSDTITWEKETLITELRKELRVSDEEHRTLLSKVNADDIIRQIREWRQSGEIPSSSLGNVQPVHDPVHSASVSASRKRQNLPLSTTPLNIGAPVPSRHSQQAIPSIHPSASTAKQEPPFGTKGKKTKPYLSSVPTGRDQPIRKGSTGTSPATELCGRALIGKKVMTRWPEDNNFYEAVITNYDEHQGLHSLSYDYNTEKESFELVNLKEIAPQDIRWIGEEPGFSNPTDRNGPIPANKKSRKDNVASENGLRKNGSEYVEIRHTGTLLKEVERVYGASHPNPLEIEKAKKMLKEHEQALIDVMSRLGDTSDSESDIEGQFDHRQKLDNGQAYVAANGHQNYKDMDCEGREGSDGDHHDGYDYGI